MRVLLIEDQRVIAKAIELMLTAQGFNQFLCRPSEHCLACGIDERGPPLIVEQKDAIGGMIGDQSCDRCWVAEVEFALFFLGN
jgi:DNA-binding response OmpR family regulator